MYVQSTQRFVFIIAPLLFAYFCINRHSTPINYINDHLPTISALIAIGCLQPPSSLARHASSASPRLTHPYSSAIVGVAILNRHSAKAELEIVNKENFKDTPYTEPPVSLKGENIFITLDEDANQTNIIWRFNSAWTIQLDRCDDTSRIAEIEIASSCKWHFVWNAYEIKLTGNRDKYQIWTFPKKKEKWKLQIQVTESDSDRPEMSVYDATDDINPTKLKGGIELNTPDYCMLATGNSSVNVAIAQPKCPVNVTIVNARLLYDFYEPTTAITASHNISNVTSSSQNNTTLFSTPLTGTTGGPGFPTWAIGVTAGVVGLLVLLAIGGLIVWIVFFCIPRRHRQQTQFDDNAGIDGQVAQKEGLIEWDDVMAHAAYKPKLDKQRPVEEWPFREGDKLELSTITKHEYGLEHFKQLVFTEDVKGSEDYGVAEGNFEGKFPAVIYYSKPSDRVKTFVDRLSRMTEVDSFRRCHQTTAIEARGRPALVPQLRYFWISPDPEKLSYLIVDYHAESVAYEMKDAEFHERVGFAYTTFAALLRLHQHGCVHRDVTPAAFVIRHEKKGDDQFCFITHLSLSRMLYNEIDKTWMPRRRRVNYFGTHKYASRAAHAMQERSFKDDIESWFFTAVELIWPTKDEKLVMPWHVFSSEIGVTDRAELHRKYKAAKDKFLRKFDKNKFIRTFPAPQFRIFAKEILKMTYETMESDYGPRFVQLLDVMLDQLPTQVDEASQKAVIDYMQSLHTHLCRREAKYKPVN